MVFHLFNVLWTILLVSMIYMILIYYGAYLDNVTVCNKTMKDHDHNLKTLFSAANIEN